MEQLEFLMHRFGEFEYYKILKELLLLFKTFIGLVHITDKY
jgi:hypothetical protein